MRLFKKALSYTFVSFIACLSLSIFSMAQASLSSELEVSQAKALSQLENRFSFTGRITGSYLINEKIITEADILILEQLENHLSEIRYPKNLSDYESLYLGTKSDRISIRFNDKYKSIIISGETINPILFVQHFSIDPQNEPKLRNLNLERLEKTSETLETYLHDDVLSSFLKIFQVRCSDGVSEKLNFHQKISTKGLERQPKKTFDISHLPEGIQDSLRELNETAKKREESTQRYKYRNIEQVIIQFNEEQLDVKILSTELEQTVSFSLDKFCEFSHLMIRDFEEEKVKRVIHLDKELKVSKIVHNNQDRVNVARTNLSSTGVAILDSGLDYNHESIRANLFPSKLQKGEEVLYEESKHHFINDLKLTEEMDKEASNLRLAIERLDPSLERSKETFEKYKLSVNKNKAEIDLINTQVKEIKTKITFKEELIARLNKVSFLDFKPKVKAEIRAERSAVSGLNFDLDALKRKLDEHGRKITYDEKMAQFHKDNLEKIINKKSDLESELSKVTLRLDQHKKMLDVFTRGVTAWNFYDDNDKPSDFWDGASSVYYTSYDHGTHVAGIILDGAESELSVFPMRYPKQIILDYERTKERKVYQAVELAYKKGIRVLNISMGTFANTSKDAEEKIKNDKNARDSWRSLERAVTDFPEMLFICAAGNDGANTDERTHYPSGFENDNIISVAAVDSNDQLADFSNFGVRTVDFAAPGVDIVSYVPNGEVGVKSGTSMATPYVSRVAGLIKHINPKLSAIEIKSILTSTLKKTSELKKTTRYGGIINEESAIKKACAGLTTVARMNKELCQ